MTSRHSSAASEASSFASNRAYCGYSPSCRYVRNTTTTAPPSNSRSTKSSYTTASLGSSFASNQAVRNYSLAVASSARNSNHRFTPNHVVRTPPPSTISEMGSSYSSADSKWSFASNRAVCNYHPAASTSAMNSRRFTIEPLAKSGARHSASSYNSSVVSGSPSFSSNRSVRGYATPLSSTMNSNFLTSSNGFVHSTTQLSNSSNETDSSRHKTATYGNFIRSSQSLESPANDPSHPTSDSHHGDPVSWPLDAGINYSTIQTSDSCDRLLPKAATYDSSYSVSFVIFAFCIVFLWLFKYH